MENQDIASSAEEGQVEESQAMDVDASTETASEPTETEAAAPASDEAVAAAETATDETPATKEEAVEAEKESTTEAEAESGEIKEESTDAPVEAKIASSVKEEDDAKEDASAEEGEIESPSEGEPSGTTDDDDKAKYEPSSPAEAKEEPAVEAPESQDFNKEEPKSPEPPMKEEDAVSMDMDSSDNNEPDPIKPTAEPPVAAPATTSYSTRGRSTEAASVDEKPDRIHIRDSFEESPRPKDPSAAVSFLVEAMTEEERRTRTRFLPEVDGMTMLRKNEIRDDLALANSLPAVVSSSGLETRTKRLGGVPNSDSMDVDGAEAPITVVDENATTIKLPLSILTTPCDAFVAPKGVLVGDTANSIEVKEFEPTVQSPSRVESVMSFNPPRPPESVGGKKKHRMTRWERRPEDIEVDMKNYRRTVQRTRQELQKSETQYERLEMIDSHLRHHFLNHSELLDKEHSSLQDQLEVEVEKLTQESDLVGSRTRSRNLSKVDVVMRDVLTMLTRNEQKDIAMDGVAKEVAASTSSEVVPGIGGLNTQAFIDWERSTELESMSPCVSWVEPGQKVTTPYGKGTVTKVIPPESPPSNETLAAADAKKPELKEKRKDMSEKELRGTLEKEKYDSLLPLRVEVQLNYGTGVFDISAIKTMEGTAHFTDAQLAKRWKGMVDSALKVGACIDLQGMIPDVDKDDAGKADEEEETSSTDLTSNDNFMTIGSTLIPTKFGRGNFLHDMEIPDVEDSLDGVLYDGHGVLGRVSREPEYEYMYLLWKEMFSELTIFYFTFF